MKSIILVLSAVVALLLIAGPASSAPAYGDYGRHFVDYYDGPDGFHRSEYFRGHDGYYERHGRYGRYPGYGYGYGRGYGGRFY